MKRTLIISAFLFFLAAAAAHPTRMVIMPEGDIMPPDWYQKTMPVNVKLLNIEVRIENQVAVTKVEQVFHNPNSCAVRGEYLFPLPEGAQVSDFKLRLGEEELEGKLLTKEEALKIYMEMLRRGGNPALLEMMNRRVFRAGLGVVPANGEVRISFEFVQALPADAGTVGYRFPLGISGEHPAPVGTLSFKAEIRSRTPIKNIVSPSHEVSIRRDGDFAATIMYEAENVPAERDLQLYYLLSEAEIGLNVFTYRSGEDGYFMLLLSPKLSGGKVVPKDIIFVIDRSGSMAGRKVIQAREALKFCLNSLNEGDRYDIISFAHDLSVFKGALQEYTTDGDNAAAVHEEALKYVEGIRAEGSTDIDAALLKALEEIKDSARPAYIVFLTDGLPTAGEQNPNKIVENATRANGKKARIFAFGVGENVNAVMLDRLAEENRGANEYVVENEDIEMKVSTFYGKVASPVLSDIAVKAAQGVELYDIYPRQMPDVFRGSQLILFGRYKGDGKVKVTLTGKAGDEEQTYEYDADFARDETVHDFLPRLWAVRKISFLTMELRNAPDGKNSEALQKEITELSQRYGVINEYVAYLIQSRGEAIPQNARFQRELNDMPEVRQEMDQAGLQSKQAVGAGGVKFSQRNIYERNAANTEEFEAQQDEAFRSAQKSLMRNVADRTYYLNDKNQFVQSDYKEKTETRRIEYLSDDYVKLIQEHPEVSRYLSVGEQVIFSVGDTWYEIYVRLAEN